MAGGKAEAVFDREANALADWLAAQTPAGSAEFVDVVQLLGLIHLCRNGILRPGAELPVLPETARLLAPVHRSAPQTLPIPLLLTVELIAELPPYRKPEQLAGKALNLMNHGVAENDVPSVAGAINLFLDAAAAASSDHPDRAGMLTNACSGWLTVYEMTGDPSAVDHAVRTGEESFAALPPQGAHRAESANNLGIALRLRFDRGGDATDLDRAIELLGEGIAYTPPDHVDLAVRQNNLGIALGTRFNHSGRRQDLDLAIATLRQAGDALGPHRRERPGFLGDLAYFHWVRFQRTGDRTDLEAAAEFFEVAVTSHDEGLQQRAYAYLQAAREELAKLPQQHGRRKGVWKRR
ncbi:tetratricopeptide repeat protein [Streptomyces sp. AK02-01A]|uniref:tetratricopeptide repeat protein n=1 Tax=Streptomyces sp. AK02-01A TaxID=3028648 RepID=UPI0029B7F516|nr:tetratricopeptide repeat protein [Streptomyces sp. AK02-01A]MDX3853918.1 tetratricopeptide repeat protein [Streptomyces sp. AK02-01A]